MSRWLEVERTEGEPLPAAAGRSLVPISQTVTVGGGRLPLALVWRRPVAVRVLAADGATELPVRDVTRRVQVALLVLGAGWALLILAARRRGPRP